MVRSDAFQKYPCYTRNDFFDYLCEAGIDRFLAFDAAERIRKGHANSSNERHRRAFEALAIPEEAKEVVKNHLYLFPRAHCIGYIFLFAK